MARGGATGVEWRGRSEAPAFEVLKFFFLMLLSRHYLQPEASGERETQGPHLSLRGGSAVIDYLRLEASGEREAQGPHVIEMR
jgi:hypothetical protein